MKKSAFDLVTIDCGCVRLEPGRPHCHLFLNAMRPFRCQTVTVSHGSRVLGFCCRVIQA